MTDVATTTKARELGHRESDDGVDITLMWAEVEGQNVTHLIVRRDDEEWVRHVEPALAYHAFTHTALYVPEAWSHA